MRIPEIRERLREIAAELAILETELYRRPPVRKNPSNRGRTRVARELIVAYADAHQDATHMEIARGLGLTNTGRVSEALAGFRE